MSSGITLTSHRSAKKYWLFHQDKRLVCHESTFKLKLTEKLKVRNRDA